MPDKWPPPDAETHDSSEKETDFSSEKKGKFENAGRQIEEFQSHIEAAVALLEDPKTRESEKNEIVAYLARAYNRADVIADASREGPRPLQVFISYSHENSGAIQNLAEGFRDQDVRYWVDYEKIASNTMQDLPTVEERRDPDSSRPIGAFSTEIQVKGIPDSSHLVVVLTREAINRFGELKKEIIAAEMQNGMSAAGRLWDGDVPSTEYGCGIVPVVMGTKEDREYVMAMIGNSEFGVRSLFTRKPIMIDPETDMKDFAGTVLNQIQSREMDRGVKSTGMNLRGRIKDRNKDIRAGHDGKFRDNKKLSTSEQGHRVRRVLDEIEGNMNDLNAAVSKIDASPEAHVVFQKLLMANNGIRGGLRDYFSKFKPGAANIFSLESSLGKEVEKRLREKGWEEEGRERSPYSVFVITKKDLEDPIAPALRESIRGAIAFAGSDPRNNEIIPIYVGTDDFGWIRSQLAKHGLGGFADYIAITTKPEADPDQLTKVVVEFARRSEFSRKAPGMYGVNYNEPLNQKMEVQVPEEASIQEISTKRIRRPIRSRF